MVVYINEEKLLVLNIVGAGTRYGESLIDKYRDAQTMMNLMES